METNATAWPNLDDPDWRPTATTLQLWTQITGKIKEPDV